MGVKEIFMDQGFIEILNKLITEQSKAPLLDPVKCKNYLHDYTKNEYKKESRMIIRAVEAGVAKAINATNELTLCKKIQIRDLQEEHGFTAEVASDMVDTLSLVLRGDTTKTIIEKTVANETNTTFSETSTLKTDVEDKYWLSVFQESSAI